MINILYSRLGSQLTHREFLVHLDELPERLRRDVLEMERWEDAQASLFGRVLLKTGLLRHYHVNRNVLEELAFTDHQRPYLPGRDLDFNISHSGEYIICILADRASVGIDVEEIRPVPIEDFSIEFSPRELTQIRRSADPCWAFFSYWARKEAISKAEGKGLSLPLGLIKLSDEKNEAMVMQRKWFLYEISLDRKHCSWFALNHRIKEEQITMEFLPFR